jgi:outer membrane lipoprotein-sorting protein
MNHPSLRAAVAAGLLALFVQGSASAQTPEQIIKKSQDAINNAKTLQIVIDASGVGGPGSGSQHVDLKAIAGQKLAVNMRVSGNANGKASTANIQMFDDGATLYAYDATKKQYRKGPSQAKNPATLTNALAGLTKVGTGVPGVAYKALPAKSIDGTLCHVIQMLPPASAPQAAKNTMLIYFDKATGLTKGSEITIDMPKGPNGQPLKMKLTTRVTSIKLNAPIAASAFKFTPPAGAKEAPAAAPGAPGIGAPRPGAPR